jgi:hypothetical protein
MIIDLGKLYSYCLNTTCRLYEIGCTFRFLVTSCWNIGARYVKFRTEIHHKFKLNYFFILSPLTYLNLVPLQPFIQVASLFLHFVLLLLQYLFSFFSPPYFFLFSVMLNFSSFPDISFCLFFLSSSRPLSFLPFLCLPLCLFSFLFFFPYFKHFTWIFPFTSTFCFSVFLISFFLLFLSIRVISFFFPLSYCISFSLFLSPFFVSYFLPYWQLSSLTVLCQPPHSNLCIPFGKHKYLFQLPVLCTEKGVILMLTSVLSLSNDVVRFYSTHWRAPFTARHRLPLGHLNRILLQSVRTMSATRIYLVSGWVIGSSTILWPHLNSVSYKA